MDQCSITARRGSVDVCDKFERGRRCLPTDRAHAASGRREILARSPPRSAVGHILASHPFSNHAVRHATRCPCPPPPPQALARARRVDDDNAYDAPIQVPRRRQLARQASRPRRPQERVAFSGGFADWPLARRVAVARLRRELRGRRGRGLLLHQGRASASPALRFVAYRPTRFDSCAVFRCGTSRWVRPCARLTLVLSDRSPCAQGISLGIADGVGGWVTSGVDPSRFAQALMYHGQRYAALGWPGEPEIDPTQDYEERESVEGWELLPHECMDMAHQGVLREKSVVAGTCRFMRSLLRRLELLSRVQHGMYNDTELVVGNATSSEVRIAPCAYYQSMGAQHGCIAASGTADMSLSVHHKFYTAKRSRHTSSTAQSTRFGLPTKYALNVLPRQLAKLPSFMGAHDGGLTDYASAADRYETKLRDGDLIVLYVRSRRFLFLNSLHCLL
jgi:hypothetical protein